MRRSTVLLLTLSALFACERHYTIGGGPKPETFSSNEGLPDRAGFTMLRWPDGVSILLVKRFRSGTEFFSQQTDHEYRGRIKLEEGDVAHELTIHAEDAQSATVTIGDQTLTLRADTMIVLDRNDDELTFRHEEVDLAELTDIDASTKYLSYRTDLFSGSDS